MLVERQIKVGDWVVIGAHEGTVKRINVRATELESFQRSAVLIPNSEVLSSAVVNWTHRDKSGRLDLPVSVAYGSDVEQVRELLLKCARAHEQVASVPPPYVLFRDFGDSGLAFELRAFLVNVEERLRVTSDLRFAIDAAFRRAKIEIPFPQRDLRLRDIDRLERALAARDPAARAAGAEPDGET
jgi:small-conductance mechanosensitive channel